MKKLILFLSLILSVGFASAQSEIPSDSIRRAPSANIKEFGGFLLDMGLMNVAPPKLPKFSLDVPNMSKDYNQLFRLNTDATYSQGFSDASIAGHSGCGYELFLWKMFQNSIDQHCFGFRIIKSFADNCGICK